MKAAKLARSWSALQCRLFGRSDLPRWSDPLSFDADWDARAQLAAALIPREARVVEFGAGLRQLERYLAPTVSYIPSDIVDRGPGTLILDLNARPLPPLSGSDTCVFCGVLEYIVNIPDVVEWLSQWASLCIASYNCAVSSPGTLSRVAEVAKRARSGWVNTLTERDLSDQFAAVGFDLIDRRLWYDAGEQEPILVFGKRGSGLSRPALPGDQAVNGRSS
jgi:hypothetical protein